MAERILVTGTGGTGVGASIMHALRQSEYPWDIVAADADPFSWGLYSADNGVLLPFAGDEEYLRAVSKVIADYDIAAVIPGTPAETAVLAEHRDEIPVPVIANRAGLMPLMLDKRKATTELARKGLFHVPSWRWERRHEAMCQWGFPLIVKPTRDTSGSRGLFLVTTKEELEALAPFVTPDSDVQPYYGDADHEYSVTVVSGRYGEIFGSFLFRRQLTGFSLHTAREFNGKRIATSTGFSQGHVMHDKTIQGFAEDMARRLDSRGPLDIQLRMIDYGSVPCAFEYQARFSFSTAFRATAGFNEPDMLLRHWLHGEDFTGADYRDGVVMRAFDHVFVPALKEG